MLPTKKDKNQQIQVFVRVRPLNKQEGFTNIIEFNSKNNKELNIRHHGHTKTYTFDRVFQPTSKQIDVYKLVAEPTVAEVISGYNCTVLAYGQTGTGKTYTMAGGNPEIDVAIPSPPSKMPWMEDVHAGLIPRTLAHLFDELRVQQIEFTVRVSYLELYNEEIFDLLSPLEDSTKLKLYDDSLKKGSVIVQGLTETTINTKSDLFKILEKGAEKRRIASTLMNSHSSRSHTVFCITVHTKENSIEGEDLLKTGKLYLVDLAGSENIKQSGATDLRAREAFNINQSLLTLGRCINKLTERATHIPYRESKLTRLLQDSLGGRTKTTLIATVSPAHCNVDETLNTLDYAFRAKSITNKPEVNQRLSKKTLLKEYTEEIERLRKDLMATKRGTGIYLDEENYNTLTEERETHKSEIAEKISIIRMLEEEMNRKEQLCNDLKISLEEHQKTVEIKEMTINTLETKLDSASKKITDLHEENEIKEFFVQKLSETEESLKSTAKELITVADTTTSDTKKLHDKLDALGDITKYNKMICEQQMAEFNMKIDGVSDNLRKLHDDQYTLLKNVGESMENVRKTVTTYNTHTEKQIARWINFVNDTNKITNDFNSDHVKSVEHLKEIQSLVAQNAEEQTELLRGDYESKVLENQEAIVKYVEDQHILIYNLHKSTEDMLQQHSLQVRTYINVALKELQETKSLVESRFEKIITMCADAQRKAIDANKRERGKQKNLEKKMYDLISSMQDYQIAANEYFHESLENDEKSLEDLKCIESYEKKNKSKFEEKLEETNILINNFDTAISFTAEANKNILADFKTKETDQNSKLNTAQSQFKNILNEFSNSAYKSCSEISNTCATKLNEQINLETLQCERITSSMKELSGVLSTETGDLLTQKEDLFGSLNTNLDTVMISSNLFEQSSSNLESSMATGLDTCREGFRKLYTSSLKEYKQTGQTPQRRFYKYPRTFTETKPKEKLIEEYHKVRSSSATRATNGGTEQTETKTSETQTQIQTRSSSESNIPRILKDTSENRGRDTSKPVNNKDYRRQLSRDENIENISTDSF